MHGDMVSELRLAALYANQVARAIRMIGYLIFLNARRSTHKNFAIDRSIATYWAPLVTLASTSDVTGLLKYWGEGGGGGGGEEGTICPTTFQLVICKWLQRGWNYRAPIQRVN